MASTTSFRKSALGLDQVSEQAHFNKASFRVKNKIFATLDEEKKTASLKLPAVEQSVYCQMKPAIAIAATGAWGKQGWTIFDLSKTPGSVIVEALNKAHSLLVSKEKLKTEVTKKTDELFQTLHPDKTKTNKRISLEKYTTIKKNLLAVLTAGERTHTELMEALYAKVKDTFEGGVQWYGETVKLDLEARKIIERTGSKPDRYRLKKSKA